MNFPTREAMLPILNRMGVVGPRRRSGSTPTSPLGLAGYIVEAASGEPYPEYVARHILTPLGMTGTRVIPPRDMPTLAVGYGRRMAGKPRRIEPFFSGNYMLAASNLASTVEDLAKYASLQFRTGPAGGAQILKGTTLAEMQRVQWLQPDWTSGWGLGWGIARRDDKTRVGHGGSVPGHRTQISFVPKEKFARHRADELRGRPHVALRQPGVRDRRARHREGRGGGDEAPDAGPRVVEVRRRLRVGGRGDPRRGPRRQAHDVRSGRGQSLDVASHPRARLGQRLPPGRRRRRRRDRHVHHRCRRARSRATRRPGTT